MKGAPMVPCPKPLRQPKKAKPAFGQGQRAQRSSGHLFEKMVSMGRRAFIRRQLCIATGRRTGEVVTAQPWMPPTLQALCPYVARVVAAHVKPGRGAGGPDAGNMVPLEWKLHELVGAKGWAWLEQAARLMPAAEIALAFEQKFLAKQSAIARAVSRGGRHAP